jgi:hypothetical protein
MQLNPKAKEFQPSAAQLPVGQTPPPSPWAGTPAAPTGGYLPFQAGQFGYYPTIHAGAYDAYMEAMPNGLVSSNHIFSPTLHLQPPSPHQYQQQSWFRAGTPLASNAGEMAIK